MRKPLFACAKTKGADQPRGNRAAGQCLCFRYKDSRIPLKALLPKSKISKPLTILCGCTAQFVSYLVGNPECRFSHKAALMLLKKAILPPFVW